MIHQSPSRRRPMAVKVAATLRNRLKRVTRVTR